MGRLVEFKSIWIDLEEAKVISFEPHEYYTGRRTYIIVDGDKRILDDFVDNVRRDWREFYSSYLSELNKIEGGCSGYYAFI